jgi:DNA processing protein
MPRHYSFGSGISIFAAADLRSARGLVCAGRTVGERQEFRGAGGVALNDSLWAGGGPAAWLSVGADWSDGGERRGIDTAAHQGALHAGGRTIAVLGTGINFVFPPENAQLFERISNQGAVVTQFPFNRPASKQTFPIRNRIVAGMTLGTVVIEANLTSGALITANMATDFGRQVFAVPGRIDSPRSKGCHELIKRGAKLCEGPEDILSEFEYLFPCSNRRPSPAETGVLPALELSPNEQRIIEVLGEEEMVIDLIVMQSGLPVSAVSATLLGLEMKRLVRQLPGKRFLRNLR